MSHLVVHVLPETQLIFGNTDFSKVEVDPPDKISQDGVIYHSLNETKMRIRLLPSLFGQKPEN